MRRHSVASFERCSFLTRYLLIGWSDSKTPIWAKMVDYGGRYDLPKWHDWNDSRAKLFAPLCALAKSIVLFGTEWSSDRPEVSSLKKFVDEHFKVDGKRMVSLAPPSLADEPLFWVGGNYLFVLIKVLCFEIEDLPAVLEIMKHHQQAGKMSPRTGGLFTKINNFAKSVVKQGGFAVISDGIECEIFFPTDAKDLVEPLENEVEGRRLAQAKMVKSRVLST
jgi:hypothetical protein